MRVPLSWLKQYVDIDLGVDELADMMTNAGMEVTQVDRLGISGAGHVWDRDRVQLAHLLEVAPHPDAERLVLAKVDFGSDEPKVVVTGAPNLFPYLEQRDVSALRLYSPILLEGATYLDPYKGGKPTLLKGKKLRGVYNDSMLASAAELGLSDDHEGIILVAEPEADFVCRPGTPLQDLLGDAVLEVDIIPNIARCASILGIAREVAALTCSRVRPPSWEVLAEGDPVDDRVAVRSERPDLNPRFVALLIEGVEQRPAPFWMQHRLRLAGQRPINVVVDVSNYVMLEMGQPNHTFDYDFLRRRADGYDPDGPVRIVTRLPQPGEKLTTLDGEEHELFDNNILVTDLAGNLSLGGIMGGLESEIQPDTRNVLLEAAAWNFINIRQTSRQLGIQTEAGFRFSRGVHPSQALLGAKRAAELLRLHAGGTVAGGIVDHYPEPIPRVTVDLDPSYVRRLSGVDLEAEEIAELLRRLEFTVEQGESGLRVTAPEYRLDIEGPHDLVEEVCRMYGYERIPSTLLRDRLPIQRGNPGLEREERIRDLLVRLGLQEVITYRLTTPEAEARAFVDWHDDRPWITLAKPSTSERVALRHHLLPSVLEVTAANSRFQEHIGLFEVGQVFLPEEGEVHPKELPRLALVLTGPRHPPHWEAADADGLLDFFDLKGVLESLLLDLKVPFLYEVAEHPSFRPGRTTRLRLGEGGPLVGTLGELHPLVVESYDLRLSAAAAAGEAQPVLAAEIELLPLLESIPDSFRVESVPTYPAVREDLALVVDESTPAAQVEATLREAGAPLLQEVELFDLYTGDNLEEGKKSLAYHLTFQSPSKTLKDKDIAKLRSRILGKLEKNVGARLR